MWTGRYVVPPGISVADAEAAAAVFGRPPLVWDNTPVNDFPPTEGRLLLGPYARREPGLSAHVAGVVLNPMNQAAASTRRPDRRRRLHLERRRLRPRPRPPVAAERLLGGTGPNRPSRATSTPCSPSSTSRTWPRRRPPTARCPSPRPRRWPAELDAFRASWASGDTAGAVDGLRRYALVLQQAPGVVRERGRRRPSPPTSSRGCWRSTRGAPALVATVDGLAARAEGDAAAADAAFAEADRLAAQARAVHTIEGETRPQGPVRVGDGVLDTFLDEAQGLT